MNEMLIAFWCGIAAVLIGETCALAVGAAWMRIQIRNARNAMHKEESK